MKKILIIYRPPSKCGGSENEALCAFYDTEYHSCYLFHQIENDPCNRGSAERPVTWHERKWIDHSLKITFERRSFHCGLSEIEISAE